MIERFKREFPTSYEEKNLNVHAKNWAKSVLGGIKMELNHHHYLIYCFNELNVNFYSSLMKLPLS